ncbi:MAG: ROK family protein [Planctomycetota bacterium]
MFLGIEIGGSKLQLGVGNGESTELVKLVRADVAPENGAAGILQQIQHLGAPLIAEHPIQRVGVGFGGPVDAGTGRVIKSHQIEGWDDFPLSQWCRETLGVPVVLGNDCDSATLAEARLGAGRGHHSVFYITVGTGVGGGFVSGATLVGRNRPACSEIGHLRPGLQAEDPEATVESVASGWGIVAAIQERIGGHMQTVPIQTDNMGLDRVQLQRRLADAREVEEEYTRDLLQRCQSDIDRITGQIVAQAATEGNLLAQSVINHACRVLGWAIAQMITLLAPEVVVIGGGVSLMGEQLFFAPVRREVARYVFPPLAGHYRIEPAALGESVVVHGAILLAGQAG